MRPPLCLLAAALSVLWLSCGRDDGPRFVAKGQHYSLRELDGWTRSEEFGATVWRSGETSIAVKAVPPGESRGRGWPEEVMKATEVVLKAMPGAQVSVGRPGELNGFLTSTFDLTFHPENREDTFARRHTVLVSKSRRIFHVFVTSRDALEAQGLREFDDVVTSLREEG